MALTQADLDRLDTAIASSELEVEIDGQRVRYRDTDKLLMARAHVASVLSRQGPQAAQQGATHYPTFVLRRD